MEAAGQCGSPHGGRLADHKNRESLQGVGDIRLGERQAGEVLWRAGYRLLADFRWREAQSRAVRAPEAEHHRALAGYWQPRLRPRSEEHTSELQSPCNL